MDTKEFLVGLLSVAGGGTALWAFMALLIKAVPALNSKPEVKFWLTFVMAFFIPTGAYMALVAIFNEPFAWEGFLLALGAGYQIAQGVHRGTEKIGEALNKQ